MYRGCVPHQGEVSADRVAAAAAQTVAAGTARLMAAWSQGSPVPAEADRRGEGIADFAARRTRLWQVPLFTAGFTAEYIERHQISDAEDLAELAVQQELVYDGANTYMHVGDNWTAFFLGDPEGPRTVNDPLWPLDALFGVTDAAQIGTDEVRGVPTVRYRARIDLARADAALAAGVTVPVGPYRALSQLTAEVWLDSAGRSRRIAVAAELTAADGQAATWSVVELWDFGVLADIVPPSPADVVPPRQAYSEAYDEDPAAPSS